ncbi:MAG TPA: hypothetical protein VMU13_03665 [Candidatus Paceibacterota bacterium]|nr:hypothetical protein [Candidatus Paceibacterota bacterium]
MTDIASGSEGVGILQESVISLSAARFEKYYHHSTGTHIIKQLDGTEFQPFPIKGFGEFADEAYSDFLRNLREYVSVRSESELLAIEKVLRRFAPAAEKKVEVQIQLPEMLTLRANASAKAAHVSLGYYLSRIILNNLPEKVDRSVVSDWRARSLEAISSGGLWHTVTLSVGSVELDRLERILFALPAEPPATMNDLVIGVLLNKQASHSGGARNIANLH